MTDFIPINIVAEDLLSSAVANALLLAAGNHFSPSTIYDNGGFGYIKKRIVAFNHAAKGIPFLVVTDLDLAVCAPGLMRVWLAGNKISHNLIFRVAEKEIESWLLASPKELAKFLHVSVKLVPGNPDNVADPKTALINLARRSQKTAIREAIVPNGHAKIGPDYNGTLVDFVENYWNIKVARTNSPSLDRALKALEKFVPDWI